MLIGGLVLNMWREESECGLSSDRMICMCRARALRVLCVQCVQCVHFSQCKLSSTPCISVCLCFNGVKMYHNMLQTLKIFTFYYELLHYREDQHETVNSAHCRHGSFQYAQCRQCLVRLWIDQGLS